MRHPSAATRHPPRRNATPQRRNATPPASHCDTTRAATRHPPRRIATPQRRNATPPASQRDTPRVALRHPPRRIATPPASQRDTPRVATRHPPCRNATTPVSRRCAACIRAPHALQLGMSPHCPLTSRLNRPKSIATKSKIVRSPAVAAVGGTGVLGKHIRPVPARESSYLLLPRAPEVCTHLGKTSTGRIGAWPKRPAGGRSHLSTSRDVTSGLTARIGGYCHE
jgi:hypothetical protein